MHAPAPSKRIYRFGLFEADPSSGEVLRQGVRVKLQDQPFRLLIVFLEHPGEVVTREQLRQQLWPAGTYVEFDGSLNATLKRLRSALGDSPENPSFIETVPKRGYRFISAVSVAGEGDRTAPEPQEHSDALLVQPMPGGIWRRLAILTTLFVIVVSAIVASSRRLPFFRKLAGTELPSQPVAPRSSVAILGFNNTSGRPEDAWLSTAFAEMLSTELAQGDKLRLVPGEDVAHLRVLAPWAQVGSLGQETTARIGAALSSDLVVLGSFTTVGNGDQRRIRLDVRLQDAASGNILQEVAETGAQDELFHLASAVGNQLRGRLGLSPPNARDQAEEISALPSNRDAARFYALGIERLRQFDALAAKDLLEQAAKEDPKSSLVHAMLARAWFELGYEQKRKEESKKALDLAAGLKRTDRMLVEADYYDAVGDHDKAAAVYHGLFELFPDSVDYGLRLADAQRLAGHGSQALATLAQLRRLPSPAGADPKIDLAEARIVDDKPSSLSLIRSALAKASTRDNKLIYATARRDECITLAYGEEPEKATAACQEAYDIYLSAGNRKGAADCLRLIADRQGGEGHYEQAISTYQQALKILQGLGEHEKTGATLNNMGSDFVNEGKLDQAEKFYREAQSNFSQAGDQLNAGIALGNIGDILYLRGNLPAAEKVYQRDLEIMQSLDPPQPSYAMYRLADIQLQRGQIAQASGGAERAIAIMRPQRGNFAELASALMLAGEVHRWGGDLDSALQNYHEALGISQKQGDMNLAEEANVALAELAVEQGHPERSQAPLRGAISRFESEKAEPDAISAYTVLSRSLLATGKKNEAKDAIAHADELAVHSTDPALKLPAAIQDARVKAAMADTAADRHTSVLNAREELLSVIRTARKLGYYRIEMEARLALGELDLQASPATGRSELQQLQTESHNRGFELISRNAQQALLHSGDVVSASAAVHGGDNPPR